MTFLVFPGVFYSIVNTILCFYPYYEEKIQSFYLISSALKSFSYLVATSQAIFLIKLMNSKLGTVLYFIMYFITIITALYIIFVICAICFDIVDRIFYQFASIIIENLGITLYTITCVLAYITSDQAEWIVSPGFCKAMRYILFANALLNFLYVIFNIIGSFGDPETIFNILFVVYDYDFNKRRSINLSVALIRTFVLGNLPVMIIVITMLYMKPKDNIKDDDDSVEMGSEELSKDLLHDNLM